LKGKRSSRCMGMPRTEKCWGKGGEISEGRGPSKERRKGGVQKGGKEDVLLTSSEGEGQQYYSKKGRGWKRQERRSLLKRKQIRFCRT